MLRKFAAAVIAASLIAGPAFAQGVLQPTPKAPAAKIETKADTKAAVTTGVKIKETGAVTQPARKHVTVVKHNRKHVRHYAHGKTHYVHVKKVKHVKHVKAKHARHIVKM
ncbi:MAG TPA: hypothetical protein VGM57_17510 [Pseudolabrys sp.]|jgi:hypothetical protein